MHPNSLILVLAIVMLGVLAISFAPAVLRSLARFGRAFAINGALLANDGGLTVGEHKGGRITGYLASAPLTTRFMLVKKGTGDDQYTICTSIADMPVAVCTDEPAATTDPVNFQWLNGCDKTQRMQASGAINDGDIVVTNGDGKVKSLPNQAGVYWQVGVAVTTAADGELVEVAPNLGQVGVSFVT